jgi:hypothetical protein
LEACSKYLPLVNRQYWGSGALYDALQTWNVAQKASVTSIETLIRNIG